MISFRPFRSWFFSDPRRRKMELINDIGLHSSSASKIWNDGDVTTKTIDKLCSHYGLTVDQVIEHIADTKK